MKPGDNITFGSRPGRCVVEQDAWKDWWRQYRAELAPKAKRAYALFRHRRFGRAAFTIQS